MSHGHLPSGAGEVRLTIDAELTAALEQRARSHLASLADAGAEQAGIVVIENATGDVLAMVGSRRYEEASASGAVNVTTALRAPGSTLKPFVYALAFEDGAHPSTPVLDEPAHWRGYQPRALREQHFGSVALRDALGSSLNVPAVRAAEGAGVERLAALLHDAGLERLDPAAPHGLSLALGGASVSLVELTNAYATLARGGEFLPWRIAAEEPRVRGRRVLHAPGLRSTRRYCTASATWATWVLVAPARSAMVRATFRVRCVLRADQPRRAAAVCRNCRAAGSSAVWASISWPCSAWLALPWRAMAAWRARATRSRTAALASPGGASSRSWAGKAGTSTCRSMRSSSGPLSLPW